MHDAGCLAKIGQKPITLNLRGKNVKKQWSDDTVKNPFIMLIYKTIEGFMLRNRNKIKVISLD